MLVGWAAAGKQLRQLPMEYYLRDFLQLDLADDSILELTANRGIPWYGSLDFDSSDPQIFRVVLGPVEEIRRQLDLAQRLVRHWVASVLDEDLGQVWGGWADDLAADPAGRPGPIDEPDYRDPLFARLIEEALDPMSPKFSVDIGEGSMTPLRPQRAPGVIEGVLVQLGNAMIEGDEAYLRRCEECDGLLVRQLGRARANQHQRSLKVKYCTVTCKDRFQQREYRKNHPELGKGGAS